MTRQPQHLPAEERRAVTVNAVIELAAEQNPARITTAAIAQRMGLTQGALFRHFANKDAIIEAVMGWVSDRLLARVDKAAQGTSSSMDALETMFMTHIDFVARHPGVPRMLFGELQRPDQTMAKTTVTTLIAKYQGRLHGLLTAGKAHGELNPELDVEAAAALFIGTIQGLVMQSLLAGKADQIRKAAPGVFAIYRRGIEALP